jgi:hypothetical protein
MSHPRHRHFSGLSCVFVNPRIVDKMTDIPIFSQSRTFKLACATAVLLALTSLPVQAGSRYQPNAAGDEVTDTTTGLVWRRCAEGQTWNGSTCAGNGQSMTWEAALASAKTQASSTGQAWRLPNAKELTSLVKYSQILPAIDTKAFPNTPSTWFWSSTPYLGDPAYAWYVAFNYGYVDLDTHDGNSSVRLVRNSP